MKTLIILTALIAVSSSIKVRCVFEDTNWGYKCSARVVSYSWVYLNEVSGSHPGGKRINDVNWAYFADDKKLTFIPTGLQGQFKAMRYLSFDGCGISSLSGPELEDYQILKKFIFTNNGLETVPGALFKRNRDLNEVDFSRNNIKWVGQQLLNGLNSLDIVDFSFNYCINKRADTHDEIMNLKDTLKNNCGRNSLDNESEKCAKLEETVREQNELIESLRKALEQNN
jgi:Leucine-rich repeat (LRR) protein